MTPLYSGKLVMLMISLLLTAFIAEGQKWTGATSSSPAEPHITFSGNITNTSEIEVEIPGFFMAEALSEGKNIILPQIPSGYPMLEQGSPDLQKLSYTLQLPDNGNVQVLVASSHYTDYPGIDILPSAGNMLRDGKKTIAEKNSVYFTDAFFPGKLFELQEAFQVRNTRAQSMQVFPFQYNPVTRVLRFYHSITFITINSTAEVVNASKVTDNRIKPVEGFDVNCINPKVSMLKAGKLPSARGSMLIICPSKFREAAEPLADWRIQTGIATEIVSSEQFNGPDALYNFVKDYYQNHGNLAYLLLVGDADLIPPYKYPHGASDNYYSYLAGNDHYPDILVGRFSAETVKDVEIQVSRTLEYEKNPQPDASWLINATGIASTLSPGDDGESDFQHVRNLLKLLKTTSYSQTNEFFDGSQGESDGAGNPSSTDITAKINQGTGILFYTGHGSPSTMATGGISKSAIENLANKGKYPLIWAAACETGNFADKYCIAEAWLRATNSSGQPAGALAALMSSGTQTSYPPMEAQDRIAEMMSSPEEEFSTMGAISVKGMMSMNDKYGSAGFATTDTWILFGDPSLRVRTALPKQLIVEHKGMIGESKTYYSFSCNASKGFACISRQGIILGTASITDGKAIVYLDQPASGEELTLTVTALNFLPYISSLNVIQQPGSIEACLPLNHSKLQPINKNFSWESADGGTPDYYLFYLGTDNPPSNLINGQKLTVEQFKTRFNFKYNSTYFWKVVAVNNYGSTESRVMDFTTIFAPDEDFETELKSRLNWTNVGINGWEKDEKEYFDGSRSLRSGIVHDNEFSSLVYPCNISGCDFVSFWSKTSSEPGDKLQFMIDGLTVGEWSGITEWSFHTYKVEPGTHQVEWRYTKNESGSAGADAAWLDNIFLPVHAQTTADVLKSASVCANSIYETEASAENYYAITWQSDGDGTFKDNNLLNAAYKPGILDIENGKTTLQMRLNGYNGCPDIEKTISLDINALPVINLPSDTIVSNGNHILLDASIDGNMTYNWQPFDSHSSSVIIDSLSSVNGIKNASVTVTCEKGCSTTKEIKVHFSNPGLDESYSIYPNPSHGLITLEPAKGSSVIEQMKLVDRAGKVVWNSAESMQIIGSKQISLNRVPAGSYLLITENKNGRSVNPLVIQ